MISESAGVDVGRFELMSEGEHWEKGGVTSLISEVVLEDSSCEFRAACGFGGDEFCLLTVFDVVPHERESDSAEVASSAEAGYDFVGIFAGQLHLFFGFQSDDGLMESYVA